MSESKDDLPDNPAAINSMELWEVANVNLKTAKKTGRPLALTPELMWERAQKYFAWCGHKKIIEEKIGFYQGESCSGYVFHTRPMSIAGLIVFLGISKQSWHSYKEREAFLDVTALIESIMFEQKFSGASVGKFNANIIARDLQLSESQKVTMENGSVTPWDKISGGDDDE